MSSQNESSVDLTQSMLDQNGEPCELVISRDKGTHLNKRYAQPAAVHNLNQTGVSLVMPDEKVAVKPEINAST